MSVEIILTVIMGFLSALYMSWFIFAAIRRKGTGKVISPSISVVIPAYNEQNYIAQTVKSVQEAGYPGKKDILVVDDGSTDRTPKILESLKKKVPGLKVIKTDHIGKAKAINAAMRYSKNEILVVLDADTEIDPRSLKEIVQPFAEKKVAAVSSTLRVATTKNLLTWMQQFEYSIATGWRFVADNVKGSCVVPGFCAFRRSSLQKIGGMKGDTAVEDYDVCMYLRKAGYDVKMSPKSIAYTRVPETIMGWAKQRVRWARGTFQMLRKHNDVIFNSKLSTVGMYSVPIQTYWFLHALIYMPVVVYQILSGYFQWFAGQGDYFSINVLTYFVKWLTAIGMFDFLYNIAIAAYPLTTLNILTTAVIVLSFGFGIFSMLKFSKLSPKLALGIFFFFPYVLVSLAVHIYAIAYQLTERDRGERWEKVH